MKVRNEVSKRMKMMKTSELMTLSLTPGMVKGEHVNFRNPVLH